jgi:hypothetical protein
MLRRSSPAATVAACFLTAGLVLVAPPVRAQDDGIVISGRYRCVGTAPGGNTYQGQVAVTHRGDIYLITREIAGVSHEGVGIRNGNILSVSWRNPSETGIAVYRILKGSRGPRLVGRWTTNPTRASDTRLADETWEPVASRPSTCSGRGPVAPRLGKRPVPPTLGDPFEAELGPRPKKPSDPPVVRATIDP